MGGQIVNRKQIELAHKIILCGIAVGIFWSRVDITANSNSERKYTEEIKIEEETTEIEEEVTEITTEIATEVIEVTTEIEVETVPEPQVLISDYDRWMLAKIAMAEAEGEDTIGKALVIRVILNRVNDEGFPNSIEEIIFQKDQFSPIENGRFYAVEPSEDCWIALEMVLNGWDESQGALYFESNGKGWHSENLFFLYKHGNHYFYSEG